MLDAEKKGRLDDLFLFFLGLTTLGFTVILAVGKVDLSTLVFAFSVLISTLPFPLYVGYIHGALIHDSALDRVRGWAVLSVEIFIMLALLLGYYHIGDSNEERALAIIGIVVAVWVAERIATIYDIPLTKADRQRIGGSIIAGYLLPLGVSLASSFIEGLSTVNNILLFALYAAIAVYVILPFSLLIIIERTCEKYPYGHSDIRGRVRLEQSARLEALPTYLRILFGMADFLQLPLRLLNKRNLVLTLVSVTVLSIMSFFIVNIHAYGYVPLAISAVISDALLIFTTVSFLST